MRFTKTIEEKIFNLTEEINNSNSFGNVTYLDSKKLKELTNIILPIIDDNELDKEALLKSIDTLIYIALKYDKMLRFGESIKIYYKILNCCSILYNKYGEKYMGDVNANIKLTYINIIEKTIKVIKSFYNWNLDDIVVICEKFMTEDEIQEYIYKVSNSISNILNDPIEMTDDYLNIIDEVEAKINEELAKIPRLTLGMCHFYWEIKKKILEEYGIIWRSPRELNDVIFD